MPLPVLPVAVLAKYGTVLLTGYALARHVRVGRTDQRSEDALDDLDDGIAVHVPRDRTQANAAGRFRRVIGLSSGRLPSYEVDIGALARIAIRKVKP